MATHSNTRAWKSPWTEGPDGLQSMGSLGVGHNWATSLYFFTFMHCRRKWQPTPVFLPGKSHGWRSQVGYSPRGHKESDTPEWLHFHFHFHAVKGFGLVNKAEVDFFQNSFAFPMIQWMLAIWSLVPLPFLNPACTWFTYWQSLAWRILSITSLVCEMNTIAQQFKHSLALLFFGIGMKTDLFKSCGHCWVFQICWHIECSTFIASSFRTWNSSTGIP